MTVLRRRSGRFVILGGIIALVAILSWVLGCSSLSRNPGSATAPDAAVFETPEWRAPGELFARWSGDTLLLRNDARPVVYGYAPGSATLFPTLPAAWEAAAGPIADCDVQLSPPSRVLEIGDDDRLRSGSRVVPTAGRTVLRLVAAPSGERVAVLSTTGRPARSVLPAIGSGGASGTHFLEILSLPGLEAEGKAVRLALGSTKEALTMCWEPAERNVIVSNVLLSRLSTVPVAPRGNRP